MGGGGIFAFNLIGQFREDRKWSGRERGGRDREMSASRDLNLGRAKHCMSAQCPDGYRWQLLTIFHSLLLILFKLFAEFIALFEACLFQRENNEFAVSLAAVL